jgi:thioredoxin-related protein
MENFRKKVISDKLRELIMDNKDFSVANLLMTVMRPVNMTNGDKDPYFMSDEDFSAALEKTIDDLNEIYA